MKKRLLLIDAYNLTYRSFYAIPSTLETKDNFPVNALYGFLKSFLAVVQKLQPDEVAVCLDAAAKTFRFEADATYKAQRKETPKTLVTQLKELSERFLPLLKLPFFVREGVEADDLIASISAQYGSDKEVYILSNDRDAYQLLRQDKVAVILPGTGSKELDIYTEHDFIRDFGIKPHQYPFYKAMTGDSSDNLKGISGIGPKTARKIVLEFDTMENLFRDTGKATARLRQEKATLEHQLMMVTMLDDLVLPIRENELNYQGINEEILKDLAHTYEFHSLYRQFFPEKKSDLNHTLSTKDLLLLDPTEAEMIFDGVICYVHYEESTALLYLYAPEKGLFHCQLDPQKSTSGDELALFEEANPRRLLKSILLRAGRVTAYNIKTLFHVLKIEARYAKLVNIDDLQLMFYLLYPNLRTYEFRDFQLQFHDQEQRHPVFTFESLLKLLEEHLVEQQLLKLYRELELPLLKVLYAMEHRGIKVSEKELDRLEHDMKEALVKLQQDIYHKTEAEFNIASPKQLAFVLFEKLQLPVIKKTKTSYSTDSEVLDHLEPLHDAIADIKHYREISKLLSTYVNAFKAKKDSNNFLHTTFLQAGPSTGRISSIEPNLQNLPSESDEDSSFSIKSVFLPSEEDYVFLAADYSQIDLRVMAHFSEDPHLIKAFLNEEDIHEQTARLIFHLKQDEEVSPAMRKTAKTVNFGMIYGMSSYALARSLKIGEREASEIIQRYFASYPQVLVFKESTIQLAKKLTYVETLLHRRRAVPELRSHQKQLQQLGERLAVNTVIQGTSADIIKLSMIKLDQKLPDHFPAGMLLQIHDELLWECKKSKLASLAELVRTEMEEAIHLKVPIKVHIKTGKRLNDLRPYSI